MLANPWNEGCLNLSLKSYFLPFAVNVVLVAAISAVGVLIILIIFILLFVCLIRTRQNSDEHEKGEVVPEIENDLETDSTF